MRFLAWWIGFMLLLLFTPKLDLYLGVFLLTLLAAALTVRRRNKPLWKIAQALGPESSSLRLVATILLFVLGTAAAGVGLWLSPTPVGRALLAAGFAAYVKVLINVVADSQERYMKRRF